jgi:tetratricopeptide (TPR) repeat protein
MSELIQRRVPFSRIKLRLAVCLALFGVTGMATANKPGNITEAEMKLLPRYCLDTMGFKYGDAYYNTSPRAGYWVSLMGKDFWAMHHYCWAQINMNRARKAGLPAQTRMGLWEEAFGDYLYVIGNSSPDFIMLPEIYTRVGQVELLRAHPDKANEAFARARQLKPDYWPAYSHWAEYLIKIGRRPEALKIVTAGLQHSPGTKVLLEQYRILGGKTSDIPKPFETPQAVIAPPTGAEPALSNNPPGN